MALNDLTRVAIPTIRQETAIKPHHDIVYDLDRISIGPPAIREGRIHLEQHVVGADLDQIISDYTSGIGALRSEVNNWQRGVTRDYTVAALAPTLADVATATVPTYPAPAPTYANWVLVPIGPDAGIYDRTTGTAITLDGFPVGTQVTVDTLAGDGASGIFQVKNEPTVGGVPQFEPFIRFTPYDRRLAIKLDADQHTFYLDISPRLTQAGDILSFSPATEAELTGLHDTDNTIIQTNTQQQGQIDGNARDITTERLRNDTQDTRLTANETLDTQQNTRLTTNEQAIEAERQLNQTQNGTLDIHTQQLGSLATRTTQLEGRQNLDDELNTQQQSRLSGIEQQLPTFDTPELRDSAIAQAIQTFWASKFPKVALISGDSRVQANYDAVRNETTFVVSGLPAGSHISRVRDPEGYAAEILKDRSINNGSTLSFAVKGNVPLSATAEGAWKVSISGHVPLNYTETATTPQPTL
jgi:hypothetical protein